THRGTSRLRVPRQLPRPTLCISKGLASVRSMPPAPFDTMRPVIRGTGETDGLTQIGLMLIVIGLAPTGGAAYTPGVISWVVMAPGAAGSGVTTDATEHDIYASLAVTGAFDSEIRESIATGLPVTFSYDL